MPSLKEFRARIASIKSTGKITRAMQMVAAARFRRAQDNLEAARPYPQKMAGILANLAASEKIEPLLCGTGSDRTHLLVVMTAERGLCGAFNGNLVRLARQCAARLREEGKTVKIITVGKKGADALKRDLAELMIEHVDLRAHKQLTAAVAAPIGSGLSGRFADGQFDVCTLIYSRFKNVLVQTPTAEQIIPVPAPEATALRAPPICEPEREQILAALLPRYIEAKILLALLENAAGEQGARMTAMDNATRNADDLVKRLDLQYNRARQAQITRELIEIISGAEALG